METPLSRKLSREALGRLFGCKAPDANSIKPPRGCLKILYENRITPAQIGSQPLGILALLECADLHRESTCERRGTGYEFQPHWGHASPNHIDGVSGSQGQIDHAAFDKWTAINDAHLGMLAVIEIRHSNDAPKGQRAMGGDESVHVEDFAARRLPSMKRRTVPGGHSPFDVGSRRNGPLGSACARVRRYRCWSSRYAGAYGFVSTPGSAKKHKYREAKIVMEG